VSQSKIPAGNRLIPLSDACLAALREWRNRFGPEFSDWVFPNPTDPRKHRLEPRPRWIAVLNAAKIPYRRIYDLRATFASRLLAAGISPLFIAYLLGHSSTTILPTYAKLADEYRRGAIQKLNDLRSHYCDLDMEEILNELRKSNSPRSQVPE
jgi:integrase